MTDAAIKAWASRRRWPSALRLEHDMSAPEELRGQAWAECQGPHERHCGAFRFSTHGCNGDGPTRAEYIEACARIYGPVS